MTQPNNTRDHVYLSIAFSNVERAKAEEIVQEVQRTAGDVDFSVDYGDPIGEDSPTPVFDKTVDETGSSPVSQEQDNTDSANTGPAEDPSNPDVQPGVGDSLPPVEEPSTDTTAPADAEPTPATPSDTPAQDQPASGEIAPGVPTPDLPGLSQPTTVVDTAGDTETADAASAQS